jgi:hypothetical protein
MKAEQKDQLIARLKGLNNQSNTLIEKITYNRTHRYEDLLSELNRLQRKVKSIKDQILPKIKTHETTNYQQHL